MLNELAQRLFGLPNLHPLVVHLPIALLPLAVATDLAGLVARRPAWSRVAAALYVSGAVAAGLAFTAGRAAAAALVEPPPEVQGLIVEHARLGRYTLWVFTIVALLQSAMWWRDRRRGAGPRSPLRWLVAVAALLGLGLLYDTATRGGELVYGHGVGVALAQDAETAIFAGGCFWCMEPPFDALDGVHSTTSGYIGGTVESPSYRQVVAGGTGHAEAVQVVYDPKRVSYERLLEVFWRNIDPLAARHQFCDYGDQYRAEIFYLDESQRQLAEASKRELETSGRFDRPLTVAITEATTFYPAEEYHQGYYRKNPGHYERYRTGCGRDRRLRELWGDEAGG